MRRIFSVSQAGGRCFKPSDESKKSHMGKAIAQHGLPKRVHPPTAPEIESAKPASTSKKSFLQKIGPGVISGAANDDPSCIVTYSMAGAALSYTTLWTSLFFLPLLAAVQSMCARLGMVSGRGLSGALRKHYPKWILLSTCALLVLANVVTLGADLGGMAEVTEMVTGIPALACTLIYSGSLAAVLFYFPFTRIERIFRWLCLALFAYLAAGLLVRANWREAMVWTLLPRVRWSKESLSVIVAIIGATMSPYFLFWQTSQKVEEEYCLGRRTVAERKGATRQELEDTRVDVFAGAFISKLITYFITLTTAATLFAAGKHQIHSAKEAAAALEPIAGPAASWLFALGVIGTGILAVPVLAGSSAYAVSEAMRWRASLEDNPGSAPQFYAVLGVSMLLGTVLIYAGLNIVQLLFWASVCNGLLAPAAILLVLLLTRNPKVMGNRVNPSWMNWLGGLSVVVTGAAAIAMLASLF